jgi:hypothetical protein
MSTVTAPEPFESFSQVWKAILGGERVLFRHASGVIREPVQATINIWADRAEYGRVFVRPATTSGETREEAALHGAESLARFFRGSKA